MVLGAFARTANRLLGGEGETPALEDGFDEFAPTVSLELSKNI